VGTRQGRVDDRAMPPVDPIEIADCHDAAAERASRERPGLAADDLEGLSGIGHGLFGQG
jgi:hypothetical protein